MPERIRVGSAEIVAANDAEYRMAPGTFLRDPSGNQIAAEAFGPYLGGADPAAPVESRVTTFVIRSRGKTILVDAGVGEWGIWRFGDGHLLESLAELDITPEMVDFVLPTHLHLDHVGWNTRPSANGPVPTFPNARYLFQQRDWEHFTRPEFLAEESPMQRMISSAVVPLEHTGLMDLIGPERTVTEEVTLLHTPGHTPGSVTIVVQSGGEAALLFGDVAHHPVELTQTDWSPAIEYDAELSRRSRKAMVDQAARLNAYVAGAHLLYSDPTFGRIVEIEGRRYWRGVGPAQ